LITIDHKPENGIAVTRCGIGSPSWTIFATISSVRRNRQQVQIAGAQPSVFGLRLGGGLSSRAARSKRARSTAPTSLRFRINGLRAVWNRIARNLPSRISDSVPVAVLLGRRERARPASAFRRDRATTSL
jgi:hypothetical protein